MKHIRQRVLALLCLLALLLSGCGMKKTGTDNWDGWPTFEPGKLQTEKLTSLEWNAGRCEATSENTMIETADGFYLVLHRYLFYADKANIGNWILVCSEPECEHKLNSQCSAFVREEKIVPYNGRICKTARAFEYPELYSTNHPVTMLVSMAPDGSDEKLEYIFEDALGTGFSEDITYLTSEQWLYYYSQYNTDGSQTAHLYRISDEGPQLIKMKENFQGSGLFAMPGVAYGASPFWSELLDDSGEIRYFYYFNNGELKTLDLAQLPSWGCYVSDGIARGFSYSQKGYYDYHLETGEQVQLADALLENSSAVMPLPNCILESTLLGQHTTEGRKIGMVHVMKLFDGEQWRDVLLPAELENARRKDYLEVVCVASDRILLRSCYASTEPAAGGIADSGYSSAIYQILLDGEELNLELCGQVVIP